MICCFCRQAHLAALEKSSAETEKLIDEAKTEKLRHMEELYQSNRRVAELEARWVPVSFFGGVCVAFGMWFCADMTCEVVGVKYQLFTFYFEE